MTLPCSSIRKNFINFFVNNHHHHFRSSSLVDKEDNSLLFVNSGMVQFKDYFLNKKQLLSPANAVSCQKCVRAGGKHNDLENVGFTARHHTFFEMLGNFSFGEYFKDYAIEYAWRFIVNELGIAKDRLCVTYYHTDQETRELWKKISGLSNSKIIAIDNDDNFWRVGSIGPCGPCTEIFYDNGEHIFGGPPGSKDQDGDRFVEIWNLVFMQFNQIASGILDPLQVKCVDTGIGLERIAAVCQGVVDNFQTDIFVPIVDAAVDLIKKNKDENISAYKIIADHVRSSAFLIADGVLPDSEGRGYVLRRIIRRATRYAHSFLGCKDLILGSLVDILVSLMGKEYPELKNNYSIIVGIIKNEEENFLETLYNGSAYFNKMLVKNNNISGEMAFKLYDTYGFPLDLTLEMAKENKIKVDICGFNQEMKRQQERSRGDYFQIKSPDNKFVDVVSQMQKTIFSGYSNLQLEGCEVVAILDRDGNKFDSVAHNKECYIILNKTVFYAESGGQIADSGYLLIDDKEAAYVEDVQKINDVYVHRCNVKLAIAENNKIIASVDKEKRASVAKNHSATHLLHAALKKILSSSVGQRGSLVSDVKLRFDFNYNGALSLDQIMEIEGAVNRDILNNYNVCTESKDYKKALLEGVVALFGEKYGNIVRVVSIGEISRELCGGIHVSTTFEIGSFRIISEGAIAKGIRRIEAVTGFFANDYISSQLFISRMIKEKFNLSPAADVALVMEALNNQNVKIKSLELDISRLMRQIIDLNIKSLKVQKIKNINFFYKNFDIVDVKYLQEGALNFIANAENTILVLLNEITRNKNKNTVFVLTSSDLNNNITANNIIKQICVKGGGGNNFARGSVSNISEIKIKNVIMSLL